MAKKKKTGLKARKSIKRMWPSSSKRLSPSPRNRRVSNMADTSKNKGRVPSSTNSLSEEADTALKKRGPNQTAKVGTAPQVKLEDRPKG